MIAFLALLFVLLVIYAMTKTKEGFNPMNTSPEHRINIPVNEIPSMLHSPPATSDANTTVGNTVSEPASNGSIFPNCDVKPSEYPGMLPGPLPTAPYEQIAVGSPLPYQDTTLIKANRQQLINMLEMIKGFLAFEAQELSERSDPTIQLPLQTARTDFHVLQMEVDVLNRNPGIQPTITLSHLNEISSNLAFLQREVRLIGAAGPIQGPIYEFTKPVEGFYGGSPDVSGSHKSKASASAMKSKKNAGHDDLDPETKKKLNSEMMKLAEKAKKENLSEEEFNKQFQELIMKVSVDHASKDGTSKKDAEMAADIIMQSLPKGAATSVKSDARSSATAGARDPKKQDKEPEKAEVITMKQSKAAADKAAAQKGVAATILSGVVAANMPAGPSDAASKSVKSGPASFNQQQPGGNGKNATLKDLQDFIVRINCESVRLSASGTSDPNMNARIVALADIKSSIDEIINQVKMDPTMEANIPVTKADLEKALPALGKPSDPLPQIIKQEKLNPGLANLLPPNMSNDPKTTKEIGSLIDKYADTFLKGVSFSVTYTSPREAQAGGGAHSEHFMNAKAEKIRRGNSTIETTGFPSMADLDNVSNAKFTPADSGLLITDRYAPLPSDAGRGPSHFDWHARSKEIEAQVKKRGLKPTDFGIMPANAKVSNDFSWKGYARMICTRLQATMDPNLPVACGCPPMDWPGWRNAK